MDECTEHPTNPIRKHRAARRLRILYAEDHPQTGEFIAKVLAAAGHEIRHVADGEAAWEALTQAFAWFDVLITDIQMPRLDGIGLVRRLREVGFAGQVVVHSGNLTTDEQQTLQSLRVDRILPKLVGPTAIIDFLATAF